MKGSKSLLTYVAIALAWTLSAGKGRGQMNGTFDAAFQRAMTAEAKDHERARQEILDMGARAIAPLEEKARHPDWKPQLTAAILLGWLQQRPLFEECTARVRGKSESKVKPVTGKTPVNIRAKLVQALGTPVVPRLLEMLIYREYANDAERGAIISALIELKDQRAVMPLIDLLNRSEEETVRSACAEVLGHLKDDRATPALAALLRARDTSPALRNSCATALARIGKPPVIELFRDILANEKEDLDLRRRAAYLSGMLGPDAAPTLISTVQTVTDERLLVNALDSLRRIGSPSALAAVRAAEIKHPSGEINRAAAAARQAIERNIAKP